MCLLDTRSSFTWVSHEGCIQQPKGDDVCVAESFRNKTQNLSIFEMERAGGYQETSIDISDDNSGVLSITQIG
jgi:hypothetical protein